jgi:N-acetylmuramoyl-L-alanine amidase-like protein
VPSPLPALLALFVLSTPPARADTVPSGIQDRMGTEVGRPAAERILGLGESLLGVPYVAGPLGEGPAGRYDRNPLSRFDGFDCTTFVETLTALSISDSWDDFKASMNRIRYKDGEVSFVARNHFTDLDWIPNNVRAGFFRDVTESLAPGRTLVARAVIDKRAWYAKLPSSRVQIPGLSADDRKRLLDELHLEGARFSPEDAAVPYIPLSALFGPGGEEIFDRIPSGSVVNIVRPNWDLAAKIGTHLNISHQGFAVRKNGVLYFLEASEVLMKVSMVPMADYLRAYLESPTIKGIDVLEIAK